MVIILLFLSILLSYFFTKKLLPFFNKNFVQKPNERSLHFKPTPSGGGIIFVILTILINCFQNNFYFLLFIPLSLVGFYDDKNDLNPCIRYIFQLLTVSSLILLSFKIGLLSNLPIEFSSIFYILIFIFLLIFGTATINFINFMDGIDGLVAGSSIIFLSTSQIIYSGNLIPLIGSLIGFLILNWNPAKVFMGDVGSTFLGALIFGEIIINTNFKNNMALLLIISPLLADAFISVIRRLYNGQNIFKAHKLHLYQRLCRAGFSHRNISLIYIVSSLIISVTYLILGFNFMIIASCIILILGFLIDKKFALPFK